MMVIEVVVVDDGGNHNILIVIINWSDWSHGSNGFNSNLDNVKLGPNVFSGMLKRSSSAHQKLLGSNK